MSKIDRQFLKSFSRDAEIALEAVAEKHGVKIDYKGARFTSANATLKFEIATVGDDGQVRSADAENFKLHAGAFGLKPEHLGAVFTVNGTQYRVTGLKPSRPKYPISAERVKDGRGFKFPASVVSGAEPVGLTSELREKFLDLACQLSPENLTCDGECSASEVRRRRTSIMRKWRALEGMVGRSVTESELYR